MGPSLMEWIRCSWGWEWEVCAPPREQVPVTESRTLLCFELTLRLRTKSSQILDTKYKTFTERDIHSIHFVRPLCILSYKMKHFRTDTVLLVTL